LLFSIPAVTPNTAQVLIRWEKVAVPFTVEVPNVEAVMRTKIDAAIAANPNDWNIPLAVARQYANDDKWDEAISGWTSQSRSKRPSRILAPRAQYLWLAGRKDEASTVADQAIQRGKADKVDTARLKTICRHESRKNVVSMDKQRTSVSSFEPSRVIEPEGFIALRG